MSVVFPSRCIFRLVGFTFHEISKDVGPDLSGNTSMCFTYFVLVDGNGHHGSSGTNSLVMVSCQTHSRCFKVILKKKNIGPRLAASTHEVTVYSFVALLAAFSSFLILFFFFLFWYNCQHLVSLPIQIGGFIPFVQQEIKEK